MKFKITYFDFIINSKLNNNIYIKNVNLKTVQVA